MSEPLLGRIIRACSDPGEVAPDPFGGSGTTLVVARKPRRWFLHSQLSPDDAAAIRRRLGAAQVGEALSVSPEPTAGGEGTRLAGEEPMSPARPPGRPRSWSFDP
jgi:DNA methylase